MTNTEQRPVDTSARLANQRTNNVFRIADPIASFGNHVPGRESQDDGI